MVSARRRAPSGGGAETRAGAEAKPAMQVNIEFELRHVRGESGLRDSVS